MKKIKHISLIGMSNSGKSYWSKKLAEKGFLRMSSDDYIEEKLEYELSRLGYAGIADVSKWLGQPYEKQHANNSLRYLDFEKESLRVFCKRIVDDFSGKNIVIDTTGSVIYTGDTLALLKKHTTIVYLDTPESVQSEMYQSYVKNPKPVLWFDSFNQKQNESDLDALKRCYPEFLAFRTKRYQEYADKIMDYFQVRKKDFSVTDFLSHI